MATSLEKELRLIRQRLDSIEEALAEEMSEDDRNALAEGLREHKEGKTIKFARIRKRRGFSYQLRLRSFLIVPLRK